MQCWTTDLVIYPFDASQNTWFAGVFEAWGPSRPYNAGGLYRTTDRGQTWSAFTCDIYPSLYRVASIAFHPSNANFAFITTEENGLQGGCGHPAEVCLSPYRRFTFIWYSQPNTGGHCCVTRPSGERCTPTWEAFQRI